LLRHGSDGRAYLLEERVHDRHQLRDRLDRGDELIYLAATSDRTLD